MIRLAKLTDYGIVILTQMAVHDAESGSRQRQTVAQVAYATRIPEPTVSKILKILVRESILESIRGTRGGYRLRREPREISVSSIIRALEGPIAMVECTDQSSTCTQEEICPVRNHWQIINLALARTLESLTLHDMTIPMRPDRFPNRISSVEKSL